MQRDGAPRSPPPAAPSATLRPYPRVAPSGHDPSRSAPSPTHLTRSATRTRHVLPTRRPGPPGPARPPPGSVEVRRAGPIRHGRHPSPTHLTRSATRMRHVLPTRRPGPPGPARAVELRRGPSRSVERARSVTVGIPRRHISPARRHARGTSCPLGAPVRPPPAADRRPPASRRETRRSTPARTAGRATGAPARGRSCDENTRALPGTRARSGATTCRRRSFPSQDLPSRAELSGRSCDENARTSPHSRTRGHPTTRRPDTRRTTRRGCSRGRRAPG